jgi:hypothetical protein
MLGRSRIYRQFDAAFYEADVWMPSFRSCPRFPAHVKTSTRAARPRLVTAEGSLENLHTVIAALPDQLAAEAPIKKLAQAGFDLKSLGAVGKGYRTEEHVVGFNNFADGITLWGSRGAFWGSLWGLFFSGVVIATPTAGPVVVLAFLAGLAISASEGALILGGGSALRAGLYSLGVPKHSIVVYEAEVTSDAFLVMVHDASEEVANAKTILATADARGWTTYPGVGFRDAHEGLAPLVA